ncbi:class I SAM-dependent methyltransferase [Paraburkholderia fungorum]|uniref:class I SAM-dependent methyltransferase n=1 Tax=Paraburkholderia fungorum TaxID=134537 RepID=UPI00209B71DD|nr:methyltransferase domain-containing protein [Paraburkholderia fungorum]
MQRYFTPGGKTADIGCCAGRNVAWLNDHGFRAVGYDASEEMPAQAATDFPSLVFRRAALPALDPVAKGPYIFGADVIIQSMKHLQSNQAFSSDESANRKCVSHLSPQTLALNNSVRVVAISQE